MLRLIRQFWVLFALVTACLLPQQASAGATCFAVDDDSATIITYNRDAPFTLRFTTTIATFAPESVEAAYFDSATNRYYLINQGGTVTFPTTVTSTFGYVDPASGIYTQITPAGSTLGTATIPAVVTFGLGGGNGTDRVTGLARNPVNNKWYIIDLNGYIYELNPITGVIVNGAFGGNDYVRVRSPSGAVLPNNYEDLAFDNAGILYALRNTAGADQFLQDINLSTGIAANSKNLGISETEGLTNSLGQLRVIVGGNGGVNTRNFYSVDPVTGALTLLYNVPAVVGVAADFEASGCNDGNLRADLALQKTVAPSAGPPGTTFTYTLRLQHQGIDPAFKVSIQDVFDPSMTYVSHTLGASCSPCSFAITGNTGTWIVNGIDIGQVRTMTFVVSSAGTPGDTAAVNRAQVVEQCEALAGACVPLVDFDSVVNNKLGAWSPTEDDEAVVTVLVTAVPSANKIFSPVSGVAGATSTLRITLSNPSSLAAATLTAAFIDLYSAGLVNASVPNAQTNCPLGVVTATPGANFVSLATGAVIPIASSCTITVAVTAASVGLYTNTIAVGSLTTSNGSNALGSSATYQVTPSNVGIIKNFVPGLIRPNNTATLTLLFSNPTTVSATFNPAFIDVYPSGLVNAATPNVQTSCLGTGAAGATAGLGTLTLPNTRYIPPSGSCSLSVVVTAAALGQYTNTIAAGSVATSVGSNQSTASDVLSVDAPSVSKTLVPAFIQPGQTSVLTIIFINPFPTGATLTAVFRDLYPLGMQNSATPAPLTSCVGGIGVTALAASNSVTLANLAVIPANSLCTVTVNVTAPAGGIFTNTIPAGSLTTTLGTNTLPAQATLNVATLTNLTVTKQRTTASGITGQTIGFTVTVVNLGLNVATAATLVDTMQGLSLTGSVFIGTVTGAAPVTVTQITTATTSINATMTIRLNGTITFRYVAIITATVGITTNTAGVYAQTGALDSTLSDNTVTVFVNVSPTALITASKTNGITTLGAGTTTAYTITFVNSGPSAADGAVVRDNPSSGMVCTGVTCSATGPAVCGAVTVAALAGGHPLTSFGANSTVTLVLSCGITATGF